MQRKVYDRDYERDLPVACPNCGVPMNLAAWEYADPELNVEHDYQVSVIYNTGKVKRPYIFDVAARNEEQAREKALDEMSKMLDADEKMRRRMYVDYIELREED